jgi:hypothetical protein
MGIIVKRKALAKISPSRDKLVRLTDFLAQFDAGPDESLTIAGKGTGMDRPPRVGCLTGTNVLLPWKCLRRPWSSPQAGRNPLGWAVH